MSGVPFAAARATGQLFLHCDREGYILWMSERARLRLGPARNLLHAVLPERHSEARRLLTTPMPPREYVQASFDRSGRSPVPLRLSRMLATEAGVLLAAEVRERRGDGLPEPFEQPLLQLHRRMVLHYFRLQHARERLERRKPNRRLGAWAAEQIERDRTRVARELHSGAGQALAGILLHLELLDAALPGAPEPVRESLQRLSVLAQEALDTVRGVAQRLHAPDWQRLPLAAALENLWRNMGIPQKFQARLELAALAAEPPQAVRVLIYRAAQETLSNVIRHAGATQVRMRVEAVAGGVRFVLEDNGAGFDAGRQMEAAEGGGIGLRSLADQVRQMGGSCEVTSAAGGTRVAIILPLAEPDE